MHPELISGVIPEGEDVTGISIRGRACGHCRGGREGRGGVGRVRAGRQPANPAGDREMICLRQVPRLRSTL